MQLFSFFSSSTAFRVRIALAIKGVDCEYKAVNLRAGEQHQLALIDDDFSLGQSLAILDYLDSSYPEPRLIPADPQQRARVLELANVIACDIHPLNNLRVQLYLKNSLGVTEEQKNTWYRHWVEQGFTVVERLLETHGDLPYCFGSAPTVADCCLIPQVWSAARAGTDITAYPRIHAIYHHCMKQPAFIQAAPEHQPDAP
jgi:maleylacetoacetate isomerase